MTAAGAEVPLPNAQKLFWSCADDPAALEQLRTALLDVFSFTARTSVPQDVMTLTRLVTGRSWFHDDDFQSAVTTKGANNMRHLGTSFFLCRAETPAITVQGVATRFLQRQATVADWFAQAAKLNRTHHLVGAAIDVAFTCHKEDEDGTPLEYFCSVDACIVTTADESLFAARSCV